MIGKRRSFQGPDMARTRALIKGMGYTDEELARPRIGVANTGYVVVHIDIPLARVIEQVHPFSTHDIDRFVIKQRHTLSQRPLTSSE